MDATTIAVIIGVAAVVIIKVVMEKKTKKTYRPGTRASASTSSTMPKVINMMKGVGGVFKSVGSSPIDWGAVVAIVVCEGIFAYMFPHWWGVMAGTLLFWFDHIAAIVLITFFVKDNPKYGDREMTTAGGWILFALLVVNTYVAHERWDTWTISGKPKVTASGSTAPGQKGSKPSAWSNMPGTEDQKVKDRTVEFFANADLPVDAEKFLIGRAEHESHYNEFGTDGKVLTQLEDDKTTSYGVMQINSVNFPYLKKICPKQCDVETLEGNLKAALYVWKQQGCKAWHACDVYASIKLTGEEPQATAVPALRRGTEKIVVPIPEEGESATVTLPGGIARFHYDVDSGTETSVNGGPWQADGPNKFISIPPRAGTTIRFKSTDGKRKEATFAFTF